MKLVDIQEQWKIDCLINSSDIINEVSRTPFLHSKYTEILNQEKRTLRILQKELKNLKIEILEFLRNKTPEGVKKGIAKNYDTTKIRRVKSEFPILQEGDDLYTQKEAEMKIQEDKVDYLEKILWEIARRKDHLATITRYQVYLSGV